jgi:hypothetical protein
MLKQATWNYEDKTRLREHFESRGQSDRAATVNTSWPLQM